MKQSFIVAALLALPAFAQPEGKDRKEPAVYSPQNVMWKDGPPSLPKGVKIAILEGDPSKPGPFVVRLKAPDGYKIPPHFHPTVERVTILSGKLFLGMGEKFSAKHALELTSGTYATFPAGMKHFVWTEGETIVQFHGDGPWSVEYVNPSDDPREKK